MPHAYASQEALYRDIDKSLQDTNFLHALAENSNLSEIVPRDVILGGTSEPNYLYKP